MIGALTLALLALLALGWATGAPDTLARWAAEGQRSFQNAMAASLRALRAGSPGAFAGLMGVCFAYGFFHAAGPGHGKVLIGGYGVGRRVAMGRLTLIALLSSLAQAGTAIVVVYAGIFTLGLGHTALRGLAEDVMAPVSQAAIGLIGLWLLIRGARRLWKARPGARHRHDHGHDHGHGDAPCPDCGHRHGPTLDEVHAIGSVRDAALLIGAIAIRPCTGALFLLILTWQMDIAAAGLAGAFAMGLGTASITIAVAIAATGLRRGAVVSLATGNLARIAIPAIEIAAGLLIVVVVARMF
ncbi:nickel/cobalt transporter [Oceaniglobus trochenteri]|uniref:nickel/cobalt transporter n=1 Tax=Oceaniglobus trochenteri TaxID=2763260 RepID=UPI001CFF8883|nr:hypothetical protein [Oceaniglobus trochenteri]